jgi:hypothetical protein
MMRSMDDRMPDGAEPEFLKHVPTSRRTFVKAVVGTTAFAAPFIASFDMQSLTASTASAQSNQTS